MSLPLCDWSDYCRWRRSVLADADYEAFARLSVSDRQTIRDICDRWDSEGGHCAESFPLPLPSVFRFNTADQVAECLEGVSSVDGLSEALWNLVNQGARSITDWLDRDGDVPILIGSEWWPKLSPAHQSALVNLALADPLWD